MHGELDTTVPIRHCERIDGRRLEDAGKPVSFVKLEGDDHYLQLGSTRLQMLTALNRSWTSTSDTRPGARPGWGGVDHGTFAPRAGLALAAAIPLEARRPSCRSRPSPTLPAIRSPGLSPDGKKFAAIQEMNGRPVVAVYTIDSDAPPLAIPSSEWVIWDFQWVSNEKLVIMASQNSRTPDERGQWTLHRTVAISADGSNRWP